MSDITRLTRSDRPVRTSGTVLSEVRRPGWRIAPVPAKGDVKTEESKKNTQPKSGKPDDTKTKPSDG